jgi:hypothetical protein
MDQERSSPNLNRAVWLGLAILFLVLFLLWLAAPGKPVVARIAVKLASPGSSYIGDY